MMGAQSHGMPMGVADGTADVVWAPGVVWAVVVAAGVLIQESCTQNGSEMSREACRHVATSTIGAEECFQSENTFAS